MKIKNLYISIIHNTNDHIKFLPLLIIYFVVILLFSNNEIFGDEGRYLTFAKNLLHGFYSPPQPNIDLWSGPGYPLLIAFFINFGAGLTILKLINSFLLFYAVYFLYKTQILLKIAEIRALLFSYLFGLAFPHIFIYLQRVLTEILSIFLVSIFIYYCIKTTRNVKIRIKDIILTGFLLSYLVLTKVIFAYVILVLLLITVLIILVYRDQRSTKNRLILIIIFSFIFITPYMIYTYSLTGKIYYPSNSGGLSLYWMSSPYNNEYGDWKRSALILENHKTEYDQIKDDDYYEYAMLMARDSALHKNHASFFNEIYALNPIEKDDALKNKAFENILNHPVKFIKNWIANIGRILFHYPLSYKNQALDTFVILIPSIFIIFLFGLASFLSLINYNRIPFVLKFLLLFISIYFFLSSLVSAYGRMFFLIIPFLILWISYAFENFIEIRIFKGKKDIHVS